MRITFFQDGGYALAGGDRVVALLAEQLSQRGHTVTGILRERRKATLREQFRSLRRGQGWIRARRREESHFSGTSVPVVLTAAGRPVTADDVPDSDFAIATWWETAEWVWSLPPSKGTKVHFVQGYEAWGKHAERAEQVLRLPIAKIVGSTWLDSMLKERFGQRPLATVEPGVDRARFYNPCAGSRDAVGFQYAHLPSKGSDIAAEACRLARREIAEMRVVASGNVSIARGLPLPDGAEYAEGARDDRLRELYSRCRAWLFSSREEGFGIPVLEAMSCGTPVIATPAGAAPELLRGGGGILLEHASPQEMAEALVRLWSLPSEEWNKMSAAAEATAAQYTWEAATDRFEKALLQLKGTA